MRCAFGCFSSVSSAARAAWLLQRGGCAEGTAPGVQHPGELREPPAALGCWWRGFPPAGQCVQWLSDLSAVMLLTKCLKGLLDPSRMGRLTSHLSCSLGLV